MGSIITSEELDDMAISTQKDWLQHEFAPVLEEDRAFWHFTPAHVKATLRPRLKFATQEFITVTAYGRCRKNHSALSSLHHGKGGFGSVPRLFQAVHSKGREAHQNEFRVSFECLSNSDSDGVD